MRMENDDNFNFLFNEEFEKIPFVFRFSKRRFVASLIIMGVSLVAATVFLNLFYDSGHYVQISTVDGLHSFGFNEYNNTYLILMILCLVVIAFFAGWMVLAKQFEKRAFRKATQLSNMISISEKNRMARAWSNWKMENRDY